MSLRQQFLRHVGQTSDSPVGIEVTHASGCYIYDRSGRRLLDFISGISVMNIGHSHPRVVEAVCAQMRLYAHTMVYGEHIQEPQVQLAGALAEIAPPGLDATFFLSTGAEANDAALKLAVKLTGRDKIVAFDRAYHGDTVGALACCGDRRFRDQFRPILFPVKHLEFGDFEALEQIDDRTAAVIIEPVQGEGGIVPPPQGYLEAMRARCTATGALLIFDEVQTAFGRVGDWFAATLFGVTPDLITLAKGMGGGLPLGGLIGSRDMLHRFAAEPPFSHITTFGGNPVSCAGALASMNVIRENALLGDAQKTGEHLMSQLRSKIGQHGECVAIRGIGLMIGIEFTSEATARRVVEASRQQGLIVETTLLNERVVRLSPPLIVTPEQCDTAVEIVAASLAKIRE